MTSDNGGGTFLGRTADRFRLVRLSMQIIAGRRWWLAGIFVLLWPAFQLWRLQMEWREVPFRWGRFADSSRTGCRCS